LAATNDHGAREAGDMNGPMSARLWCHLASSPKALSPDAPLKAEPGSVGRLVAFSGEAEPRRRAIMAEPPE